MSDHDPPTKSAALRLAKKTASDRLTHRFEAMLPDVSSIVENIIEMDLDHTQAVEVETNVDEMVDWAPNVIDWCVDPRFLNMRPYAKQVEVLLALYEEACVFCSDMEYTTNIPVSDTIEQIMSKVALLEFGVCPHCHRTKAEGRASGVLKDPIEMMGIFGQRVGKSSVVSMAAGYQVHRFAALKVPWRSFGLTPGQTLDFTFVATTVAQSDKTIWSTFIGMFTASEWFRRYKEACNTVGQERYGVKEVVKHSETFLWFDHKRLLAYFASNNPASLRGTTRFGGALDEFSWFQADDEGGRVRANGPETYAAINNACTTVRIAADAEIQANPASTIPTAIMFEISSPRAMNDPLMAHARQQVNNPRCVRRHWATWEAHPSLTRERLAKLGLLNTSTWERDFGAQPPLTDNPLFGRTSAVLDAFQTPLALDPVYGPVISPMLTASMAEVEVLSGRTTQLNIAATLDTKPVTLDMEAVKNAPMEPLGPHKMLWADLLIKPASKRPHILSVDLGHSRNGLAICAGYLADKGSKFITDFAVGLKPTNNRTINLALVFENVIVPAVERLNVVAVIYDRWESYQQIQDLTNRYGAVSPLASGTEQRRWKKAIQEEKKTVTSFLAERYSLDAKDARVLVARLEQGDCLFPAMEIPMMELVLNQQLDPTSYPYAHLALQLSTVRCSGRSLLKPMNGDDDLFRAWANCASRAFLDEVVIGLLMSNTVDRRPAAKRTVSTGNTAPILGSKAKGTKRFTVGTSNLPRAHVITGKARTNNNGS